MFYVFFLLFVILPIAEITLLIKVGSHIGALNTILLVFGISALGAYLTRVQGFLVLSRIQESLARGIVPSQEILDGAMILAGGILLLTPGFLTDIIGLFFLFPPTRSLIRYFLKKKLETMNRKGQVVPFKAFNGDRKGGYDDIDV
jgi:UPF0716 protein FxsA